VNQDQIKKVEVILGEIKGQRKEKQQESRGPEEDHTAFEQLNILIVIALHIHGVIMLHAALTVENILFRTDSESVT
jgi:hypothetical protein